MRATVIDQVYERKQPVYPGCFIFLNNIYKYILKYCILFDA